MKRAIQVRSTLRQEFCRPVSALLGVLAALSPALAQNTLTMPNGATNSGPSSVVIRGPLPDILFTEMQLGQNGARAALYLASAPNGETFGVWGQSASANGTGVVGIASAEGGPNAGIKGISSSPDGYAGYFQGRAYFSTSLRVAAPVPALGVYVHALGAILSERIGGFAEFRGRRRAGSSANPQPLDADQFMLLLSGQGYTGTEFRSGADIAVVSAQDWAPGSHGARLVFRTVDNDSTLLVEQMRIDPNGNVGINTSGSSQRLHVAGNICATGTIGTCSDSRFKKNVAPIPNALDLLDRLRGVSFEWNRDAYPGHQFPGGRHLGFVAQDVAAILPQLVMKGADGYFSLDYARVTPVIVEALRELRRDTECRLNHQEQRLAGLESETARINARLARLEHRLNRLARE